MGIIDGIKNTAINAKWEIQARAEILANDKDGNGKLNKEEYQAISVLYSEDNFISNHSRSFEFGAIDELKVADGEISGAELAKFYQSFDGNNNGKFDEEDLKAYERFLSKSSGINQISHPLASLSTWVGVAGYAIEDMLFKSRN